MLNFCKQVVGTKENRSIFLRRPLTDKLWLTNHVKSE